MSEGSAHGLLEMPCLGRPFQLGMLYDCRNDCLIPGVTLWGPDTLGTAKHAMMEGSDFEVITEDSFNQKTLHLDVSAGLKLSVLGGLVKAGGSGKFLYDRTTSKNQARVSLRYKSTSRFEQLNMSQLGKFEYPRVFEDDIATHVVTGVQYGADAVFVFDRQVDSNEKFSQVHGNLEAMISVLPSIDLQVGGSADLNEGKEKIQCKFYGDLILPKNPTTYQDAVRVYQELPKLLGGASVPKKVWLYPLSKLDSSVQRMVRDINSQLIDDLQDVMESLHELEMQINDLVKSEVCLIFAQIKGCLEKMKRLIGSYKEKTMKNLSTLLPNVRGGCEEEAKLAELLEDNGTSPFSSELISSWIGWKEEEIAVLGQYLIELDKYPIKLAFSISELISLTSGFTGDSILCFDFNIPVERDIQLVRMEAYLHGKSLTKEQELEASVLYRSPRLRHQFQRFLRFVSINSDKKGTTYVVTNSSKATTNNLGVMSLFVNSYKTEFEPPDQPGVPCALSRTHNSLQLSWAKPKYGSDCVQTYTVSYRSLTDPSDQWITQTSSEDCLVLTKLTPGSLYHFKVTAESAVGSSPESEVGEERLPPDQPGKPETTEKIHNSLQLRWSKPEHGASIVNSYTIRYRLVDDPPDQWSKQTSKNSEECSVLTKLTPGSLYHFKVTAESAVGSSPESEVGEERLPPDQPGKPNGSCVTCSSIQLNWTQPKHGAEFVQCYTISYQSINNQYGTLTTTSKHECVTLTNLASKTFYTFKVRAESAAGSGPESELSDAIETMAPSLGKPLVSDKTHNSVKLNWNMELCTVLYRFENDPSQEWMKHTCKAGKSVQSLELTGLVPGSVYNFKVNSAGFSASDICQVTLPPDQPGRPKVTGKTLSSVHLKWAKPIQGAASVLHYTVLCQSIEEKLFHQMTHVFEELLVVSNLLPGTAYRFKVRAEGAGGSSPDSESIEVTLPPSQPSKPKASTVYCNKILLKWSPPKHGAQIVSSYLISYRSVSSKKWWLHVSQNSDSASILGLAPKTKYVFKVRAEAADAGSSPDSELSDPIETLLLPPGKPYATKKTHNSIRLAWEKPEHGFESVVEYAILSHCEHDSSDRWTTLKTNKPIEHIDYINLRPGSVYTFKVRAETSTGPSQESDTTIVTLPPGQPGTPLVFINTCDSVRITWSMPAKHGSLGVQHYTILYRSMAGSDWQIRSTNGAEEFIKISNLLPGAVYNFKVRAEGAGGSSPESESVEAKLPLNQLIGKPEADAVFHDRILLNWSPQTHEAQIYTIFYRPESSSNNWCRVISRNNSGVITNLVPSMAYVFKVRVETSEVGRHAIIESELSDPIKTLLPPPGKPYAAYVSYKDFLIKWGKPHISAVIKHYLLFYRSEDEKWNELLTSDNKSSYNFTANNLEKAYVFKVSAVTLIGDTAESEISDPIKTRAMPWGAKILNSCKKIGSINDSFHIYEIPLQIAMRKNGIEKVVVRNSSLHFITAGVPHKVLMLVGATGAGKSTLINGMANYIMGVDWEDDFRFKLIPEEIAHDQTKSQRQCITAYTFHKDRGSALPYTLTVIDTPGFGDTGGLERDKQIIKQIKDFFSIRGDEGIDQLHGIGFVTQAPLARLTPAQQYVFDSILSVFAKDVADNIFLMVTFADGKQPPVLDAARAAGVPFKCNFKFNNSALFACKQAGNEFDRMFWKMGEKSFEDFFNDFSKAETQSLQLSRQVLQEREQLEVTIEGLQPQICAGLAKIDELRQKRQMLKDHEADIITHKNFNYQVQVTKRRKVDLPPGHYTINCLKCSFTCHDNCKCNDSDKYKCSAMNNQGQQDATCTVCPGKCSWKNHASFTYRFELYHETETRTSDELKAKYESAMSGKIQTEAVMKKMKEELESMNHAVLHKIQQAKQCLQRLKEIALRPDHLTEVEYIDILIESEKQQARPCWSQRVQALHEVRKQAEILADIQSRREENEFFPQPPKDKDEQQPPYLWEKFKSWWKIDN